MQFDPSKPSKFRIIRNFMSLELLSESIAIYFSKLRLDFLIFKKALTLHSCSFLTFELLFVSSPLRRTPTARIWPVAIILDCKPIFEISMTYTFVWYRSSLVKVTGATNRKMGYMFFLFRFRNKTTFYLQAKLLVIQKSTSK